MARNRWSYYSDYSAYPAYVSVAEKKRRNEKAAAQLKRDGVAVSPVTIKGRTIATSWWGKSWNANLERYADYCNRIERGRSYVRHGAVLDLKIEPGKIEALVQGHDDDPYKIEITIDKLAEEMWADLKKNAMDNLDSMSDLLAGSFPKDLKEVFFARGTGLFPAPAQIKFSCSCPDWASMCKHVASVLYGVGNRLDQSPELLFELRRVSMAELISRTIDATAKDLTGKADSAAGDDILADADLADVFGIALDDAHPSAVSLPSPAELTQKSPKTTKTKSARGKTQKRSPTKTKTTTNTSDKATTRSTAKATKNTKRSTAGTSSAHATAKDKKIRGKTTTTSTTTSATKGKAAAGSDTSSAAGGSVEQLIAALKGIRGSFQTSDVQRRLPEWPKIKVANALQRALTTGRIVRQGRGVYQRASK